ncbi:replication protein [Chloroflexota bacterium]
MEGSRRAGFRRIDNAPFQALMAAQLTGAGYQIVLTIIDRTLGFQKEKAKIPLTYFQKATGISRQSVCEAIKQAEERHIITVVRNSTRPSTYALNDQTQWLPRKRNHPNKLGNEITPNWSTKSPQASKPVMRNTMTTKETLKETLKEKGTNKENRVLSRTSHEGTSPPQTPPSLKSKIPTLREGSTVNRNVSSDATASSHRRELTAKEKVIAFLSQHDISRIADIVEGTGIRANAVNATLHFGKGRLFYHDSENRGWGLIEDQEVGRS